MRNNRYRFQGIDYDITSTDNDLLTYGLVSKEDFQVASLLVKEDCVEVALVCEKLKQKKYSFYPFEVEVWVKYIFSGSKLDVIISGKNCGDIDAPFGCGWSPYFRLSDNSIDNLVLSIPADKLVLTNPEFIPFPGEMTYSYLSNLPGSDFRPIVYSKKRALGKRLLNVCYSHLQPGQDNLITSKLESYDSGASIAIKQERGVVYFCTGDENSLRYRRSISIQPAEFITDAFNRSELYDKILLPAGGEKKFRIQAQFRQQS